MVFGLLFAGATLFAVVARESRVGFAVAIALTALIGGFLSGGLRTARVAAPVLDHIRIVELTGFIEEMDLRRSGARFVLRVASAEGLDRRSDARARQAHDEAGAAGCRRRFRRR